MDRQYKGLYKYLGTVTKGNFLNISGHFLLLRVEGPVPGEVNLWSPMFLGTRQQQCSLEVWLFMSKMSRSTLRLVSNSTTQWVVHEEQGNNDERWEQFRYKIGLIRQNFSLILEVVPEGAAPALVALDNLRLVDCFDGEEPDTSFSCVSIILVNAKLHFFRLGSIPVQVMCVLWWAKWHWGGFSLSVLIQPASPHSLIILSSDFMQSRYLQHC